MLLLNLLCSVLYKNDDNSIKLLIDFEIRNKLNGCTVLTTLDIGILQSISSHRSYFCDSNNFIIIIATDNILCKYCFQGTTVILMVYLNPLDHAMPVTTVHLMLTDLLS